MDVRHGEHFRKPFTMQIFNKNVAPCRKGQQALETHLGPGFECRAGP
ncbi:hypothetical protein SB48_HM08orf01865 [Heyndrickxia coagulans]|uniref:Uncharacterized protein n=1 Tax=Heyndrickxia coagulans TaxID=1398 RepID=A0AAN0T376_HEYCO|nr:hypothetical protein SB48_HM08orf01865 [Heyndrickxia coagulans]